MAEKVKIARQGMTWRHIAIVVTMCLSIFTAVGIIFTAAGLCYRPVAQHFGVPVSQVSLYITFVYLGQMAGGVPGGLLFDKFNAKTVCCVAAILVVVPYIGFAFYPAIWCYWVAGFIIGLGLAVVEFTMTAGILSRWFHTNYGTVTGIVFAFTGVGGVVWNLIGQIVLGPQLAGWHELYIIFSICMLVGTLPFIAIFVKRTPEECGTLPFGMPIDKEAMENELAAEEAIAKGEAEEGFKAKEVLKFPFFWTLLLGAGLLNTITTMSQLFATYVQFLGHEGWYGAEPLVALLLLSGTLEAFASAGQGGGKVLIGFIESHSLYAAQIIGYCGGVIGLLMMWWFPQILGEGGIWPMFFGGLFYGLAYACSTAMLPFLVRQVFGGRDFDKIYSWMISVFNGIGALGATGWALVAEGFGWHGFFIGGIIVLTITFGLLGYTWHAGDKARRKTWFKSDAELAAEAHKTVESA